MPGCAPDLMSILLEFAGGAARVPVGVLPCTSDTGQRKLRVRLAAEYPDLAWPAASTITTFLHNEGLIRARARRRAGGSTRSNPNPSPRPFRANRAILCARA